MKRKVPDTCILNAKRTLHPRKIFLQVPDKWLTQANIDTAHIDPGKPWQNGSNKSFNGTFRDECLGLEWFRSRAEAVAVIETWRRHYNEVRPHSSLGYLTPQQFKQKQSPKQSTCEKASSTELLVH